MALLLQLAKVDERTLINCAKALATSVQGKDAALLLDELLICLLLVLMARIPRLSAFTKAIGDLKPERIDGAGGLITQHDAMLAAGADAGFGEPSVGGTSGVEERIAWWAEVFENSVCRLCSIR